MAHERRGTSLGGDHREKILNPSSRASIGHPDNRCRTPDGPWYGLGWLIHDADGALTYWHNGSLPGLTSILCSSPARSGGHGRVTWTAMVNTRTVVPQRDDTEPIDPLPVGAFLDRGMLEAVDALLPGVLTPA